jgi:hypothetical protein
MPRRSFCSHRCFKGVGERALPDFVLMPKAFKNTDFTCKLWPLSKRIGLWISIHLLSRIVPDSIIVALRKILKQPLCVAGGVFLMACVSSRITGNGRLFCLWTSDRIHARGRAGKLFILYCINDVKDIMKLCRAVYCSWTTSYLYNSVADVYSHKLAICALDLGVYLTLEPGAMILIEIWWLYSP